MLQKLLGQKEIEIGGMKVLVKLYKRENLHYRDGYSYVGTCSVLNAQKKLYDRLRNRYEKQIKVAKQRLEELEKKRNKLG